MASLICGNTEVGYSLLDRRVTFFELDGKILYNADTGLSVEGWQDRLREWWETAGLMPESPFIVHGAK